MKNKFLRLIRFGAVTGLLVPVLALAAYNDVTLSTDSTLGMSVGGSDLQFTSSDGLIESITVGASSVDIVMGGGSTMTVTSTDRKTFTYSGANRTTVNFTCGASNSIISFTLSASESNETITLTPTGSTCSTSSGGGGGGGGGDNGGGGGGGGGGSVSPAPEPTPTPAPTTAALVIASVPAVAVAQSSPVAQVVSPVFNSDLSLGSKGDDVTKLQELMAKDSEIYPEGLVTGYFGPATQRAVRKFQAKHGLPQVGRVGPATRAKLNEVSGGQPQSSAPAPAPAPAAAASAVSASEQKSMEDQLKSLQDLLKVLQQQTGQ